jgi:hypothetical protein
MRGQKEKREAFVRNGVEYLHVTTALTIINKLPLLYWYGKHGTKRCRELSAIAAERGKLGHSMAEHYLIKREHHPNLIYQPEEFQEAMERFALWCSDVEIEPIKLENKVYSDHWQVVGTYDFKGHICGEMTVADWKFGGGLWPEYDLQIAAYPFMEKEMELGYENTVAFYRDNPPPTRVLVKFLTEQEKDPKKDKKLPFEVRFAENPDEPRTQFKHAIPGFVHAVELYKLFNPPRLHPGKGDSNVHT